MTKRRKVPTVEKMRKRLQKYLLENGSRLVSKSNLKNMAKAMDPDIRVDANVHSAMVREVAKIMLKSIQRVYDNKRATIRPSDL